MTATYTYTKTFARIDLIKTQFKFLLAETTDISDYWMKKITEDGIDKKWLSSVIVYAVDSNKICHAQIHLKIDWGKHNEIVAGSATIHLNKPWKGDNQDVSPGVNVVVSTFGKFVEEKSLTTIWRYFYTDNVDQASLNREMGAETGEPIIWKNNTKGEDQQLTKLNEVVVGYRYA